MASTTTNTRLSLMDNDCNRWQIINIINAITNLFGTVAYHIPGLPWYDKSLIFVTIVASMLMHLSERKHYLPGIKPFSHWAKWFLLLDRYTSIEMASILIYYTWKYNLWEIIFMNSMIGTYIFGGLLSAFISEIIFTQDSSLHKIGFVIFHTIWHLAAYTIIFGILLLVTKERKMRGD